MPPITITPRLGEFCLFFLLFFTNQMSFQGSDLTPHELHATVVVRIAVLSGLFLYFLPSLGLFMYLGRQLHIFLHLLLLFYFCIISLNPEGLHLYAYYGLATQFMMLLVICCLVQRFGLNNMIYYYFIGTILFCLVSLVFYYAIPEIGRYIYWNNKVIYESPRLKGIAGHPNIFGQMLALALVIFLHMVVNRFPLNKFMWLGSGIILFCLMITESRTSIAAMCIACGLYLAFRLRGVPIMGILVSSFAMLVLFFGKVIGDLMQSVSRSGDVSELTTFTGRTYIWNFVYKHFLDHPFFGWGYSSVGAALESHTAEIGFSVRQAHSVYLQLLFTGGIVGLSLFIIGMMTLVMFALRMNRPLVASLVVVLLFVGVTETAILSTIANNAYLVLAMALFGVSGPLIRPGLMVPEARPLKFEPVEAA